MERLLARYTNSYAAYVILFFFYDLAFALFSALISVYLIDKGYAASQVSLLISAAALGNMVTQPFIGSLTERFGMRAVNMVLFAASCFAAALFVMAPSFAIIVIAYALINIIMNGVNPTVERMATSSPYSYGSIRIWGSLGFSAGTQVTGLLYDHIAPVAPYVAFIFVMLIAIVGFWGTNPRIAEAETASIEADDEAEPVSIKDLLTNKLFLYYIVIMVIFAAVTGATYSFCAAYLTAKGLEAATASTILSVAALLEVPLLFFSSKFMDKISNKVLLFVMCAMVVFEMAVYGLNMPLPLIIVATFIGRHPPAILSIMTNMKVVNTICDPRQQITALALVKSCQSFGTIITNNIGGNIVDAAGYPAMFMFLLALSAACLALVVFFRVPSGNDKKLFS